MQRLRRLAIGRGLVFGAVYNQGLIQLGGGGLSIVEILSTCPVGWGLTPTESMEHLANDVVKTYPLGVLVDRARETSATAGGG